MIMVSDRESFQFVIALMMCAAAVGIWIIFAIHLRPFVAKYTLRHH